jgi:hypothetical protein
MTRNGQFHDFIFSNRCILNYSRPILEKNNLGNQQICKESKKTPLEDPKTGLKGLTRSRRRRRRRRRRRTPDTRIPV